MTSSNPPPSIAQFVESAFDNLETGGPNYWTAGGSEPVSFESTLHDDNAAFEEQSFWFAQRNRVFLNLLKRYGVEGPLLDIGGGTGIVANYLNANGVPAVNLEPTVDGARIARARGVPTISGTLQNCGVKPETCAAIGMFDVLEHIEDEGEAMRLSATALKPGGHIIIAVPAHSWLWSMEDHAAGHYRRYTRRRLSNSMEKAGLRPLYLTHLFSYLVPPLLALRSVPTLWGRMGKKDREEKGSVHVPGGIVASIFDRLGKAERAAIERGASLPLGTSVVGVAVK